MKAVVTGWDTNVVVEACVWSWFRPSAMPRIKIRGPESKTQLAMTMTLCRVVKNRTGLFKVLTTGGYRGSLNRQPPAHINGQHATALK